MDAPRDDSIRILREDDPEHDRLLADGWRVVGTSWGARLALPDNADLTAYREAVAAAQGDGYAVERLSADAVPAVSALEDSITADYPYTPATAGGPLPADLGEHLADGSWLAFGARTPQGELVAFTIVHPEADRWEVERTGVARAHRRRGLATAVKAASILQTHEAGARRWGTGGAAANAGSLAMNRSLGFVLEPVWHSLQAPVA